MLGGQRAARAHEVVDAIADALREPAPETASSGTLHAGYAARAIFFAQLAAWSGRGRDQDTAIEAIDQAGDALAEVATDPSFFAGFPGVGWAIEHLAPRLFEGDDDDAGAELDEAVALRLAATPFDGHFDLVSGLVGLGVYALERRRCAPALIERVVALLDATRSVGPGTSTWFTSPQLLSDWERGREPDGFYNLGLAHGVPGVVALLGHVVRIGAGGALARELLDGAVRWLLDQQLPAGASARYSWWSASGNDAPPARSAWCYGDPGVAAALLVAASATGQPAHHEAAMEVARCAATRPFAECMVADAGLCHGAAGLLHIFTRIWNATDDETCRRAAERWFDHTLSFRGSSGIAGFIPHGDPGPGTERGLLEGAAGIGLALLAASTSIEPAWDRMLLVDVPRSERT